MKFASTRVIRGSTCVIVVRCIALVQTGACLFAMCGGDLRLLFVTHDLAEDNCHLQPWRTICEAVTNLRGVGVTAQLLSLGIDARSYAAAGIPAGTLQLTKQSHNLARELGDYVRAYEADLLLWPLSWRQPQRRLSVATGTGVPVVGYFPGGVYDFRSAVVALRKIGREAAPYVLEALIPKRRKLSLLRSAGLAGLIAQSEFTARKAVECGWPAERMHVIYPARGDAGDGQAACLPKEIDHWLAGRPYFLFMGPPSGIRGTSELLRAFDKAASEDQDITLVCLFRPDADVDSCQTPALIKSLEHTSRIYARYDRLDRRCLNAMMARCYALVLPFLIVPAEIPLVMIEALQWGRPILTTNCGGSGEFVRPFGLTSPAGDVRALARAMLRLRVDGALHADKCKAAQVAFRRHPTARETAIMWRDAATAALAV